VFLNSASGGNSSLHYRLLSAAAMQIWRGETGRPLKLVMGTRSPAIGIAFYSPDHPVVNPRDTASDRSIGRIPDINVDPEEIRRSGMLAVCGGTASQCTWLRRLLPPSASAAPLHEITLVRRLLWWSRPATFVIVAVPPVS
jgi:hypothetical protein